MVRQQFLTGIPVFKILGLLVKNGFSVIYILDAFRLLKVGFISTLFGLVERLIHHRKIEKTQIIDDPVFIIGHWRSGTTYLHKILAQDKSLATPTFYQCALPQSFIVSESKVKPVLAKTTQATRIFDAMAFGVDEPFDDEFAMLKLTACSRMLHFVFPVTPIFEDHTRFYHVNKHEWSRAFMAFAKKLTYVTGRRLLFKSPMNTMRIAELLDIFPKANFIYIYRRPDNVFVSSLHQADKLFEHNELRKNTTDVKQFILSRYLSLFDRYKTQKKLIPDSQLVEVAFEALEDSPIEVVRSIYEKLGIEGLEHALPDIKCYLEATQSYKKNSYDLCENDRRLIHQNWSEAYQTFGYAVN